jgi:hypothetical protein
MEPNKGNRPKTAIFNHARRISMQIPKTQKINLEKKSSKIFNGIHPGLPFETKANDMRFDLLINDLMP